MKQVKCRSISSLPALRCHRMTSRFPPFIKYFHASRWYGRGVHLYGRVISAKAVSLAAVFFRRQNPKVFRDVQAGNEPPLHGDDVIDFVLDPG